MADGKQRPDAAEPSTEKAGRGQGGKRPENQTDESKGGVRGEQLTDDVAPERWDTKRGSEPETRGSAGPRGGGSGRS